MVTASKVQQGRPPLPQRPSGHQEANQSEALPSLHVGTDPLSWSHAGLAEDTGSIQAGSLRGSLHGGPGNGMFAVESTESDSNMSLCFGQQLVLETYMWNKGRRYDRQRQDELSQPRRQKHDAPKAQVQDQMTLDKAQVKQLVGRLSKPRRPSSSDDAGRMVMLHGLTRDEPSRAKTAADAEAVFRRLASPKPSKAFDPTPGERVCLMYNRCKTAARPVNLDRLNDMAKPKKRGGRAQSWGVSASFSIRSDGSVSMMGTPCDHSFISQQLPPAPMSARGPCASHQSARPIETSKTERSPEVVEDYSFPRPAIESHRQGGAVAAAAENWRPVESRPPVAGAPRDGRLPQVAPCDAVEFNDGDCSDYYDEETDDPVSYRPVSLQAYSATAAAAQPVQSAQADEEGSDDEEPIFPQFGFAGQRTSR